MRQNRVMGGLYLSKRLDRQLDQNNLHAGLHTPVRTISASGGGGRDLLYRFASGFKPFEGGPMSNQINSPGSAPKTLAVLIDADNCSATVIRQTMPE